MLSRTNSGKISSDKAAYPQRMRCLILPVPQDLPAAVLLLFLRQRVLSSHLSLQNFGYPYIMNFMQINNGKGATYEGLSYHTGNCLQMGVYQSTALISR